MSVLTVSHVTHGFGARQILDDASFRLLKGEHVGLIGANGEGKSTFLSIITGKILPDEGTVQWSNKGTVGIWISIAYWPKGRLYATCYAMRSAIYLNWIKSYRPLTWR